MFTNKGVLLPHRTNSETAEENMIDWERSSSLTSSDDNFENKFHYFVNPNKLLSNGFHSSSESQLKTKQELTTVSVKRKPCAGINTSIHVRDHLIAEQLKID